jgi:integrase/recombinase XerD
LAPGGGWVWARCYGNRALITARDPESSCPRGVRGSGSLTGQTAGGPRLAEVAGVRIARPHPQMLRYAFVTTSFGAGVDLRDVQIAARHAEVPPR